MAKLQRNAAGKLLRSSFGKILRGTPCCCGEPPTTGDCAYYTAPPCAPDSTAYMASVYKVVVTANTLCGPCVDHGDGTSSQVTGTINRTYYIDAKDQFGDPPNHTVHIALGKFFAASATNVSGALTATLYGTSDCTGTPLQESDVFSAGFTLTGDGITAGAQTASVNISAESGYSAFAAAPFGALYSVTNFCGAASTIGNRITSGDCGAAIGYGGSAEVTPCPPCAVNCVALACLEITSTGTCDYDPDGDDYTGGGSEGLWTNAGVQGIETGYAPAGCVWRYSREVENPDHTESYQLYIWFDGQDYRGLLTRTLDGVETAIGFSYEAASITCTDDVLAGSLVLENGARTCTFTATLNDCAGPIPCARSCLDSESDLPATITVSDANPANFGACGTAATTETEWDGILTKSTNLCSWESGSTSGEEWGGKVLTGTAATCFLEDTGGGTCRWQLLISGSGGVTLFLGYKTTGDTPAGTYTPDPGGCYQASVTVG